MRSFSSDGGRVPHVSQAWLTAAVLVVALHCYDAYDRAGVRRGVVIVDEKEWRFVLYDARGRGIESGEADALPSVLKGRALVEIERPCAVFEAPCAGRATRC